VAYDLDGHIGAVKLAPFTAGAAIGKAYVGVTVVGGFKDV
jgi:hypothetical protein